MAFDLFFKILIKCLDLTGLSFKQSSKQQRQQKITAIRSNFRTSFYCEITLRCKIRAA